MANPNTTLSLTVKKSADANGFYCVLQLSGILALGMCARHAPALYPIVLYHLQMASGLRAMTMRHSLLGV